MTNLKVGDKVTLKPESKWVCEDSQEESSMNPLHLEGNVIQVRRSSPIGLDTVVVWANGNENQYNEEDLIKMEAEVKFVVGDTVQLSPASRFAAFGSANPLETDGEVVLVRNDESLNIQVKWAVGVVNSYNPEDLFHVEKLPFKVGDVVVIAPDSMYYEYNNPYNPSHIKGVVVEVNKNRVPQVKWDNGKTNSYEFKDLLKVDVAVEIGDTVMVIGDDAVHLFALGTLGKVVGQGMRPDGSSVKVLDESCGLVQYVGKGGLVVVEKGTTVPAEAPAPLPEDAAEEAVEVVKVYKLSYKKYKDKHDDFFKVDTSYSPENVSFEPCEDESGEKSPDVILDVQGVKRLRKQLKNWLDANGHND